MYLTQGLHRAVQQTPDETMTVFGDRRRTCREVADRFYAMDRGVVTISGPIASLTDAVVKEHLQV